MLNLILKIMSIIFLLLTLRHFDKRLSERFQSFNDFIENIKYDIRWYWSCNNSILFFRHMYKHGRIGVSSIKSLYNEIKWMDETGANWGDIFNQLFYCSLSDVDIIVPYPGGYTDERTTVLFNHSWNPFMPILETYRDFCKTG